MLLAMLAPCRAAPHLCMLCRLCYAFRLSSGIRNMPRPVTSLDLQTTFAGTPKGCSQDVYLITNTDVQVDLQTMDVDKRTSYPYHVGGIRAFEQRKFSEAVRLWSLALYNKERDAAEILCNRSAAYAQQGCWVEAMNDARQALYLQPDNITAHYRLAQACFHVRQYKQCLNACQAALKIKPGARQPRQLHQLAADLIRSDFLTHRNPEVEQAIAATSQAALQEERQSRQQQHLQRQVSEATASAIMNRKRVHTLQQESFLRWNSEHDCDGSKVSVELISTDDSYKLLGVKRGATEVDIRLAYVRAMKEAHPDKGGSTEQFHQVQAAYHQLKQKD